MVSIHQHREYYYKYYINRNKRIASEHFHFYSLTVEISGNVPDDVKTKALASYSFNSLLLVNGFNIYYDQYLDDKTGN